MMESSRARRIAAVVAALVLVAGLWWWLRGRDDGAGSDGASAGREAAAPAAHPLGAGPSPSAVPPLAGEGPAPEPPIIDRVTVEKTEVCQGEENLVRVDAHTPHGRDDAYLHAVIGGHAGMSVPIRSFLDEGGRQPAPRRVTVFGRQNVATTVEIPPFEVKDCMVERVARIRWRLRPNTDAEFDIGVRVQDVAATTPFEPVRYRWRFGDGTTDETETPWTTHSYDDRPQDRALYANYVVQVAVVGASGETVVGRRTLHLRNAHYSNLVNAGVVTLATSLHPRFPVLDADGVVRQRVRLWHHRPDPVRIDRIWVRRNFMEPGSEPEVREGSVMDVLGTTSIPPHGITIAVQLDTEAEPDLFSIDYLLEGESAEGLPVKGVFPVMRPSKLPTKEDHIPVRDPELIAKIKRARELLDKPYVTDEEIWRLEREGAFDDIEIPERDSNAPPPTYADMPPGPPRGPGAPAPDEPLKPGESMPVFGRDKLGGTAAGGGDTGGR